jgi:hypothetical protein
LPSPAELLLPRALSRSEAQSPLNFLLKHPKPPESANLHSRREILPLDMRGANAMSVRASAANHDRALRQGHKGNPFKQGGNMKQEVREAPKLAQAQQRLEEIQNKRTELVSHEASLNANRIGAEGGWA